MLSYRGGTPEADEASAGRPTSVGEVRRPPSAAGGHVTWNVVAIPSSKWLSNSPSSSSAMLQNST